ncbi:hypothetical protein [Helicobacter sp. T3_23-1056]
MTITRLSCNSIGGKFTPRFLKTISVIMLRLKSTKPALATPK